MQPANEYLRVVKVGGSLFDLPDLNSRIANWLATQPGRRNLFVFGGGGAVEAMRELDRIHSIPACRMHWLCVDLLSATSQLAVLLLGGQAERVASPARLQQLCTPSITVEPHASEVYVVDPACFYSPEVSHGLPENWDTTTDSIAAALARQTGAEELVLMKSVGPALRWLDPGLDDIVSMSAAGEVDKAFRSAASGIPRIGVVNLRDSRWLRVA